MLPRGPLESAQRGSVRVGWGAQVWFEIDLEMDKEFGVIEA